MAGLKLMYENIYERKEKRMYKLIFKDDDKNIISSLNTIYEELSAIRQNIYNYGCSTSGHNADFFRSLSDEIECVHTLTGEILRNIKDEVGTYIISLSCPLYIAQRIVEHSAMALDVFKNFKIMCEIWELKPSDRNILKLTQSEISYCSYILKYAKPTNNRAKKRLNHIYGHTDTDLIGGVFDDYPEFINGFVQSPAIPCDGEDLEKSSK